MEEFNRELAEILEVDDVHPSDVLADFDAWDSLAALSVIVMIQSKYGAVVSGPELRGAKTAKDLYDLVMRKRTLSTSTSSE